MAGRGTNILAADFNQIQSKIATVLGTGSGNYGYGQTVSSTQVTPTETITAAKWLALRNDLIKARQHQLGTDLSDSLPFPDVTLPLTEDARAQYVQMADTISLDANRLIAPPSSQATRENLLPIQQRTTWWNGVISQTITVTFPTADAARYFFNTGSRIEFSASRTNITGVYQYSYSYSASASKVDSWTYVLSSMGTIYFNHTETRCTGTGSNSAIGFYDLTTSNQLIFSKFAAAGVYANNKYYIYARRNADSTQIVFTIEFRDDAVGNVDEPVDGTLRSICQVYRASGNNVSVPTPLATTSGLPGGQVVITTPPPIVPTYTISPSANAVSENTTITYTVFTSNVSSGTTLYWTLGGTIGTADVTNGIVSGSVTISNNAASFNVQILADQLTETTENLFIRLRTGSITGPVVATSSTTTVYDTSTTPPPPPPSGAVEFSVGGATYSWTVPSNVYLIRATVIGAGGAGGASRRELKQFGGGGGGSGGQRTSTLGVTPGEILTIKVGGGAAGVSGGSSGIYKGGAALLVATGGSKGGDAYSASGSNVVGTNDGQPGQGGAGGSPNGVPGTPGLVCANDQDIGYGLGVAAGGWGGSLSNAAYGSGGGGPRGGTSYIGFQYAGWPGLATGDGGGGAGVQQVNNSTVQSPYPGGAGAPGRVSISWG